MVEDLIQLPGFLVLQLVTPGRYARIRPGDALRLEGTVGCLPLVTAFGGLYKVIA
jgi:hypothetical protein